MTAPTKTTSPGDPGENRRRSTVTGVQPSKPKSPSIEAGVSSHLPWQTAYQDLWEALRTDDIPVRDLVAMRRTDGQARALYRLITLPIRAALKTATFVPGEDVDGGDEEAQFIEQMLTLPPSAGGMMTPFGRVIAQMLMAVFDGFSAFELVYWQPKTGPLKGKWTLQKMAHRPSEQLTFLLNDKSEFTKLRQRTMYHNKQVDVTMDAENVVYFAANEEERPLYGQSYFNAAFHHWEAKFKLYVIAQIAAQRAAVGTRVGTMPENPDREEKTEFQSALARLGVAQWITMSDKFKVESLKEFSGFDFLGYINHHNSQMSKSVLAAFFDDSQGTGGDASLVDFGRQSDALFLLMLQTIMGEVEEVINTQLIPKFIDWNFDSGKYPRFSFGSLTEEQKGIMLDLYKALAVAGDTARVTPEVFREIEKQITELFGLEIDWEEVASREADEAAQAEAAAAAGQVGPDGQPLPPGGGDAATPADPLQAGGASVDPANVPDGFTLTNPTDDLDVTLTDLAAELLDDALTSLTRGRPNSGGPKFVRSAEGAKTYGVPVGTAITPAMDKALAKHGQKGAKFGVSRTHNPNPTKRHIPGQKGSGGSEGDTSRNTEVHGGGKGAAANLGGVNTSGGEAPAMHIFSNPKEPGAQLIDYGDGTVALRYADGKFSPRQKIDVGLFAKFGWKVDAAASPAKAVEKATPGPKSAGK